jgi:hypothetical protein
MKNQPAKQLLKCFAKAENHPEGASEGDGELLAKFIARRS